MKILVEKKHGSPVSDSQFSFTFRFEKLVFAVYLTVRYGGYPCFFYIIIIYLISQCLLNIL